MRRITFVILTGVVLGVFMGEVLFVATSVTQPYTYLGPLCAQTVSDPGFDPWTGEPHGRIFTGRWAAGGCVTGQAALTTITAEPPTDMIGRRAIPVPAGFALGVAIALIWWGRAGFGSRR